MSTHLSIKSICAAIFGVLALYFAITAFFETAEVSTGRSAQSHWRWSKLEIVALVRRGEWEVLEKEYTNLHRKFDSGEADWTEVSQAFKAFDYADPHLRQAFADWVKAMPNSFVAHAARGQYLSNLGFAMRGTKYISDTHPEQIRQMVTYLRRAVPELKKSIEINPRTVQSYDRMMTIDQFLGDYGGIWQTYVYGYFRVADATALTRQMADALQPKWSRHPEHWVWFKRFAHIAGLFDSGFRSVLDEEAFREAEAAAENENSDTALNLWTEILTTHKYPYVYLRRAQVLRALGREDDALRDALIAIQKAPEFGKAHLTAAAIYSRSNRREKALFHYDAALRLDPYDPAALLGRAGLLISLNRFSEAERDLDDALVFGEWETNVQWWRATLLRNPRLNPAKAKQAYLRLLEIEPTNEKFLREYEHFLNLNRDCDYFVHRQKILDICLPKGRCGRDDLDRTVFQANRATSNGRCRTVPDFSRYYSLYFPAMTNLDEAAVAGLKLGQGRKEILATHPDAVIAPVPGGDSPTPLVYQARRGSLQHPPRLIISLTADDRIFGIQLMENVAHPGDLKTVEQRFIKRYGPPDTRRLNKALELEYRQPGLPGKYAKTLTITLSPFHSKNPKNSSTPPDRIQIRMQFGDNVISERLFAMTAKIAREQRAGTGAAVNR